MKYDDNELNRAKSAFAFALAESFEENEQNEITRPIAGLIADALASYSAAILACRAKAGRDDMESVIIGGYADDLAHQVLAGCVRMGPTDSELASRALKFYGGERAAEAA